MSTSDLSLPPQCPRCLNHTKPVRVTGGLLCNGCGDWIRRPKEPAENPAPPRTALFLDAIFPKPNSSFHTRRAP